MAQMRLAFFLCLSVGCATAQHGPAARPPDPKVSVVGEGLSVNVAATELPWVVSRGKGGSEAFLQLDLPEAHAALTMMVSPTERLEPALTIFMVQATLLQNGLTVSPMQSMNADNTDVRISFSGKSKAVGQGGGQVRSWIVPGTGKTVVLMGMWPESLNGPASADFETLVRGIKAAPAE